MAWITGGLASAGALLKSIEHIPDGELAVKVRGGRLDRRYNSYFYTKRPGDFHGYRGKGLAFSIPFLERYVRVNIQENVDTLPNLTLTSQEGLQMLVGSAVTWHVIGEGDNPYKALLKLNDPFNKNNFAELRQKVVKISAQGLSVVMNGMPEKQMYEFDEISGNVRDECKDELFDYGVNMVGMQFEAPYLTPAEVHRQATLEMAGAVSKAGQAQALSTYMLAALIHQQANAAGSISREPGDPSLHVA